MTHLAQRPQDTRRFAGLGSSPMATKPKGTPKATASPAPKVAPTLGQQLVRALVPRHFPTLTAVQIASGLAYSTLMNWKNGTKLPDWESVELMAKLAGVDPMELLGKRNNDATALRIRRRPRSRLSPRGRFALQRKFARVRNPDGPIGRAVPRVPRRPVDQPRSLLEFQRAFPDEAACARGVIAYDYGVCPKQRGLLVGHGTKHLLLGRQSDDFNEADAWIATGLWLIPPHHTHSMGLSEIVARAWAPEWFVRLVVASRRGCFFGASDESYRL